VPIVFAADTRHGRSLEVWLDGVACDRDGHVGRLALRTPDRRILWKLRAARIRWRRPMALRQQKGRPAPFSRQPIRPNSMAICLIALSNMIAPLDSGVVLLP
jgi:hypothetical protein